MWLGLLYFPLAFADPAAEGAPEGWTEVVLPDTDLRTVRSRPRAPAPPRPAIVVPYRLATEEEGVWKPPNPPPGAPPLQTRLFVPDPVRTPSALAETRLDDGIWLHDPGPARPYADEEIVVWGDRLQAAKRAIAQKMESMGYRGNPQGDGRTQWRPTGEDFWKPRLLVDDDGWYTVDTPTVALEGLRMAQPPADDGDPTEVFEQAPTPINIGPRFTVVGRRVAKAAEARLVREVEPLIRELREAQADAGLAGRLDALPGILERLWRDGVDEDGTVHATIEERQRAILGLWATRTDTRAGATVRVAIERYLTEVVDDEAPLNPAWIVEAERSCDCEFPGR